MGDWKHQNREPGRDRLGNDRTYEFLILATISNLNTRPVILVDDLEGEPFDIGLHFWVREFAANETFDIEYAGDGNKWVITG